MKKNKIHENPHKLKPNQIVNHFVRTFGLTTKIGLSRSLRNLHWFTNETSMSFFPRSYDLTREEELYDFMYDFKLTKA
jgi:hypothetical protein